MRRFRLALAMMALLALGMLVFRPVALEAFDVPYGVQGSSAMEVVTASGSQHCELLSDCETISFATIGLNATQAASFVLIAGLVMFVAAAPVRRLQSWLALVPNPPPLTSLG